MLSCVWNLRVFPEMHDGDSAPSCCAFTQRCPCILGKALGGHLEMLLAVGEGGRMGGRGRERKMGERETSTIHSPEEEMATHSSILAWEIPWTEEPGRLQSTGSLRVRHD